MVIIARKWIPNQLQDTSPTGAAWIRGPWEAVAKGLVIGLIIGMCTQCLMIFAKHFVPHSKLSPLGQMALTPGMPQAIWFIMTVLVAPPVEEMMFRGVFYGGYRSSLGPFWAGVATTLLFVALHFDRYTMLN